MVMHPSIKQARQLANILDNAFNLPVINKRIGLDPIIGALPIAGDITTLILSLYPVWVAFEVGIPRKVMVTMIFNILIDYLIGLIPFYGDVVDAFWRANTRNVDLLEREYEILMEGKAKGYWDNNAERNKHSKASHQAANAVVDVTPNQ